jgi:superfamily II DNA or RNA helicase
MRSSVTTVTPPALRPYQRHDVRRIREHFASGVVRVCYQLPTGGGKTVVFCYIATAAAARGSRVVILAHRAEILEQIDRALTLFGVGHGVIAAGYPSTPNERVQIASVFTIVRQLACIGHFDLIVVDEAHHAVASTCHNILATLSDARVLGVTATPERLDGKGLDDIFEELVLGPTVRTLIDEKYLAPYVAFGPKIAPDLSRVKNSLGDYQQDQLAEVMSDAVVIRSAVTEYRRICPGAKAIAFCVDTDHSRKVAKAFCDDGWRAAHVDGTTHRDERRDLIASLAGGSLDVLCNCGLISEGLDVSGVEAVILLRPTMSRALYLQQVGRGLRPGKPRAVILDHAGCTLRHGLPDAPHGWTLHGRQADSAAERHTSQCEACGAFNPPTAIHCEECGHALVKAAAPAEPKLRVDVASELIEINTTDTTSVSWLKTQSYTDVVKWAGRDWRRLDQVCRARGYKPGWIYHRLKEPKSDVA